MLKKIFRFVVITTMLTVFTTLIAVYFEYTTFNEIGAYVTRVSGSISAYRQDSASWILSHAQLTVHALTVVLAILFLKMLQLLAQRKKLSSDLKMYHKTISDLNIKNHDLSNEERARANILREAMHAELYSSNGFGQKVNAKIADLHAQGEKTHEHQELLETGMTNLYKQIENLSQIVANQNGIDADDLVEQVEGGLSFTH